MAKLTDKQQAFVDHYLMCMNATEAAARAGYNATRASLAVIGSNNLSNVKIRAEIDARLRQHTMKADEVLYRLGQHAEGLPPECFETSFGGIMVDFEKVKALGLTHLIKKVTYTSKGYAQIELHDAQSALIQLGKHYELFTDKVKNEDWRDTALEYIRNREVSYQTLADEFGHDLATELFKQAGVPVEARTGAPSDTGQ